MDHKLKVALPQTRTTRSIEERRADVAREVSPVLRRLAPASPLTNPTRRPTPSKGFKRPI
jgi:hypothetical protein